MKVIVLKEINLNSPDMGFMPKSAGGLNKFHITLEDGTVQEAYTTLDLDDFNDLVDSDSFEIHSVAKYTMETKIYSHDIITIIQFVEIEV